MSERRKRIKRLNGDRLNALIDSTEEEKFELHKPQSYKPISEPEKTSNELFTIANQYFEGTESNKNRSYEEKVNKDNRNIFKIILSGFVILGIVIGVLLLTRG